MKGALSNLRRTIYLKKRRYVEDKSESPSQCENDRLLEHHREVVERNRKESIAKRIATRKALESDDDEYKGF